MDTSNQNIWDNKYFAVIDTETNWDDEVMSIGVVIAYKETCSIADQKYYVITPECEQPSMFGYALNACDPLTKCNRPSAISDLCSLLQRYCIEDILAYNARFDCNRLPELNDFTWRDIMRIAANKQYNHSIPRNAQCFSTGRLRRNYGVEPIMRMLTKNEWYFERHNALQDARDELMIMQLLGYPTEQYPSFQEISAMNAGGHIRLERREQRKKEIAAHLLQGNIDLINYESTNNPVTIKCRACGYLWDVSFHIASNRLPKCPHCFPKVLPDSKRKLTFEEQLQARGKDFADLISAKSDRKLKLIEYRGSNKDATVMCTVCNYCWDIRADHLRSRCYCPQCKKQRRP